MDFPLHGWNSAGASGQRRFVTLTPWASTNWYNSYQATVKTFNTSPRTKLHCHPNPSIGPQRQGISSALRSIELAATTLHSTARVARDAVLLRLESFELFLELDCHPSSLRSRPPSPHCLRQRRLPAPADPPDPRHLQSDACQHRVAMGHDAAAGAGRPVDAAEGPDEERLARIDVAGEESRYVYTLYLAILCFPPHHLRHSCMHAILRKFARFPLLTSQQHTGSPLALMDPAPKHHQVKAGRSSAVSRTL